MAGGIACSGPVMEGVGSAAGAGACAAVSAGTGSVCDGLNRGQAQVPNLEAFRNELLDALAGLRKLGITEEQVTGLSVFTTQSATAVVEHIRDRLKAAIPDRANFLLGAGGSRTVFSLNSIGDIEWQQQIQDEPACFSALQAAVPRRNQTFSPA